MGVEPAFGPFTFWQRWLVGHALRGGDTPPPPPGFASWADYYNIVIRGGGDLTTFTSPGGIPRGRKATMVWTREGEDVATIGMHFLHRDGSDVADFVDADEVTINAKLLDLWDDIKSEAPASIALDRIAWHKFGVGVRKPNPETNAYIQTPAVAGGADAGDELPPQDACSVTFKTSVRRNWGRVYVPPTIAGNVSVGRFAVAYCELVRTAFGTLLDAAASAQLPLVVWCPRHGGELLQFFKRDADHPESAHTLNLDEPDSTSFARTVDQVQVDDIVDTIRSRRYAKALVRATHTLP